MWKHHKIANKQSPFLGPKKQTLIRTDLKKGAGLEFGKCQKKLRSLSLTYLMGNNNNNNISMKFWEKKNRQHLSAKK
jgi:hypothetical protein